MVLAVLSTPFLIVAWVAVVAAIALAVVAAQRSGRIRERLRAEHATQFDAQPGPGEERMGFLRRWLYVAGLRRPGSVQVFLAASAGALLLGLAVALTLQVSSRLLHAREWLYALPGSIGAVLDPVLVSVPWFLFLMLALAPWLYVRSARRRRVKQIEEDLPITLQLLSTLSRAGLGFDAALVRVLDSSDATRPLAIELQEFRRENLAGMPRSDCWRRLAERVDLDSISMFVSALMHAEQVGGGIADVLLHQTEDVQSRRRERALIVAQGLQVKLVFPLVICFLPGIFVWTLGPAFYQFLKVLDGIMRNTGSTPL
jgi:pilus assembly protein TadC